jgi:hypothetical protein
MSELDCPAAQKLGKLEVAENEACAKSPHFHRDPRGVVHACYHHCRRVFLDWAFWIGLTVGFPLEHFLWEKVPPFSLLTKWLGL